MWALPFVVLPSSTSGLLETGGPIEAEAGGVISIGSGWENVVDVVEDGMMGRCRDAPKPDSAAKGLRANGSAMRLMALMEYELTLARMKAI